MAEVLVKFIAPVRGGGGADGQLYWAQACGRVGDDGLWEGWLEFSTNQGEAVCTGRETQQPNRDDLVYWAEGLTAAYIDGALDRALRLAEGPPMRLVETSAAPRFERPATDRPVMVGGGTSIEPSAVLNPFALYREGEDLLRKRLSALSRDHLDHIARAYGLVDDSPRSVTADGSSSDIAEHIIRAVRREVKGTEGKEETQPHGA